MRKNLVKRGIATLLGATMLLGTTLTAMAAPETGTNISQQNIPVTATIDSYYEVGVPAGFTGVTLTREFNDYLTTTGDGQGTFYGYAPISIKGVIDAAQKVETTVTCADLTGPATVPVDMNKLTAADAAKIIKVFTGSASEKEANAMTFASWGAGSTGVTIDFLSADVNESTLTSKYVALHTNLPKDGTYTSQLVVNFTLKANA